MAILEPAVVGLAVFLFTLGVDLASKAVAVSTLPASRVVFNPAHEGDTAKRVALGLAAILAVYVLSLLARWRGVGRLWGTWAFLGLLVGGIAGNGLSHAIWSRGTPDFIWASGHWVWNLADFAIGIGLVGAVAATAAAALGAVWRDRRGQQPGSGSSSRHAATQKANS
jgi:hypothetical protein